MKNKGFTLIELLAVIVILAIIALIAVPIILNIVDSSKTSANERSKELYLDAVEQAIAKEKMKDIDFNPTSCTVQENGDLTCVGYKEPLKVETTGAKPNEGGTITLQNGKIKSDTLAFGEENTEEVSQICTLVEGISQTVGSKYTCTLDKARTFYVLENAASSDDITLLMEQNFTDGTIKGTVAWCTDGGSENTCKNIESPDVKDYIGHITSVFNKEGVAVSFPTKSQIEGAYTDTMPEWMYDYLKDTTHSVPGVSGYWTSTSHPSNHDYAWSVSYYGLINFNYVNNNDGLGLRPIITISKSLLN